MHEVLLASFFPSTTSDPPFRRRREAGAPCVPKSIGVQPDSQPDTGHSGRYRPWPTKYRYRCSRWTVFSCPGVQKQQQSNPPLFCVQSCPTIRYAQGESFTFECFADLPRNWRLRWFRLWRDYPEPFQGGGLRRGRIWSRVLRHVPHAVGTSVVVVQTTVHTLSTEQHSSQGRNSAHHIGAKLGVDKGALDSSHSHKARGLVCARKFTVRGAISVHLFLEVHKWWVAVHSTGAY